MIERADTIELSRRAALALLIGAGIIVNLPHARAEDSDKQTELVQKILAERCVECHSPRKRSGKLNLSNLIGVARGGESGEVIAAGKPDDSLLWQRIDAEDMPPDAPLGADERSVIREWISAGAHGLPASADVGKAGDGADHWAFRAPARPAVPAPSDESAVANPVDAFVLAELAEIGLSLAPEADRATLIRRVSLGLTGLPPSPDEIAAYLTDASPDAYSRMVERYLASPHYGERWGRHWLDVAGYADSNGYFNADTDRPLAYKYRDYVIRSFNADKPFDQFVTEQLAGDELAGYRPDGDITPEQVELYTATHFLRNGQDGTDSSDGNADELLLDRFSVLEGATQIIGSSLLGMTLQCARCHDHKFEPISQREYYSLQAFLYPAYLPDQWLKAKERVLTVGTRAEREAHAAEVARIDGEIQNLEKSLADAAAPLREQLLQERLRELEPAEREAILAARAKPEEEPDESQKELLKRHKKLLEVSDEALDERFGELAELRKGFGGRIEKLKAERPAPLETLSAYFEVTDQPPAHHVLERGAYRAPGEEVAPTVPAVLCASSDEFELPAKPEGQFSSGRRTELARWVTSPEHPTFARLAVNRIWQEHFGAGIVATSDNFGYTGTEPTHPELLDYLATTFATEGFSVKGIHRLILHSRTYRQSSAPRDEALKVDPTNAKLWRFPLQRLDAETVRDCMLAASGFLDRAAAGPYVPTVRAEDGSVSVAADQPGRHRRSLYLQQRRTQLPTLLEVFDAPSMVTNCSRRATSTVALQSLALLNAPLVNECADALAERIAGTGENADDRIARAFLLTFGRSPTSDERRAALEFIEQGGSDEPAAWRDLCQMLLASNPFLYLE